MTENIESTTESTPKTVTLAPTFAELGVRPETVAALAAVGINRAFAIQEYALPIALRGTDLIGQAPTGTGKTLGFGVPLLDRVLAPAEGADGAPQALVVVPTRELGPAGRHGPRGRRHAPAASACCRSTAASPTSRRSTRCSKGVEILVGTPGRLLDLAQAEAPQARPRPARSCSTRPTACSTWASSTTSRRSWRCCRRTGRPCCSRPPCPTRSSRCPAGSCATPVTIHAGHDRRDRAVAR